MSNGGGGGGGNGKPRYNFFTGEKFDDVERYSVGSKTDMNQGYGYSSSN